MGIQTKTIRIPNELQIEDTPKKLLLKFQGLDYPISKENFLINYTQGALEFKFLKRQKKKKLAIIKLYERAIEKYTRKPLFVYTLDFSYSHFPISLSLDKEKKELTISNFLGVKKPFKFYLPTALELELKQRRLVIRARNDILMGSQINRIKNIRYLTIQKKLDKRVFVDGFTVSKGIRWTQ